MTGTPRFRPNSRASPRPFVKLEEMPRTSRCNRFGRSLDSGCGVHRPEGRCVTALVKLSILSGCEALALAAAAPASFVVGIGSSRAERVNRHRSGRPRRVRLLRLSGGCRGGRAERRLMRDSRQDTPPPTAGRARDRMLLSCSRRHCARRRGMVASGSNGR